MFFKRDFKMQKRGAVRAPADSNRNLEISEMKE